jgi:hypothetical protein
MRGWLYLDAADIRSEDELTPWIDRAVGYSATLPPKGMITPEPAPCPTAS